MISHDLARPAATSRDERPRPHAQVLKPNDPSRTYGQSVTEACMDWPSTEKLLGELAGVVKARRVPPSLPRTASTGSVHGGASFVEIGQIEATDNLRVSRIRPLLAAAVCIEELGAESAIQQQVRGPTLTPDPSPHPQPSP